MIPVHLLDREELSAALAYLSGALPCRTNGILLMTSKGEFVGQLLTKQDCRRFVPLLAQSHDNARQLAEQVGNGSFRYQIDVCGDGATLTLALDETYLVSINLINLKSLDAVLAAVREGLPPLLEVLGL